MFATLAKTESAGVPDGAGRSTIQNSPAKKKSQSAPAAVPAPARSSTTTSSLFGDDSGDEQVRCCFLHPFFLLTSAKKSLYITLAWHPCMQLCA